MNIKEAKLCLDCDEIFTGYKEKSCPKCASNTWIWVETFLKSIFQVRTMEKINGI